MEQVKLSLEEVHDLAARALMANGCDQRNADATAANMTLAERNGCASHGIFRVPGYVKSLKAGKINGASNPTVTRTGPCVVQADGDRGMAPVAQAAGLPVLVEAARESGMAALAIRRAHHYAALWPETQPLAEQGLVAIAFVNSPPYMAPAGGTKKFFGTNPMSFAYPRADGGAMAWDQASSMMARGEISIAMRDGHAIPEGAGIDADGNPATDPAAILAGAQLPFGGYKGGAIALMVDLMCGPLIGEVSSAEAGAEDNGDGGPATGGELILAFDPKHFGGDDAIARGEKLFAAMLEQDGVRLPGDRRQAAVKRTPTEGVAFPKSLIDTIQGLLG